ncbi:hypothetical protein [Streptomyces endocoffeicus]|uniref:hypothetical protein n=1 Tax=Streptomyces endocoffeicus TaxID=2898945 RepID=UPI001E45ADE1|nr:hypothetical protein [Streptomyces endocoffeicus]
MIVIGYRDGLDEALRRRDLEPFYIVQVPVNTPEGRGFKYVTDMENAQEISPGRCSQASTRRIAYSIWKHSRKTRG